MSFQTVQVEVEAPVAIVTVDRPEKRNALNALVRAELLEAIDQLADDDSVRVLIVTGAGEKAFVAGADISEFASRTAVEQNESMAVRRIFEALAAYPKPTIAMINGYALGGGCELALACDMRIASDTAHLGQPEINLGLIPGGGGTQHLPRVVGTGWAMRLVLTGELISAARAQEIGLVDEVVPAAQLREHCLKLAREIGSRSPVALRAAKAAVRAAMEMPMAAGLTYETSLFVNCFGSEDAREGIDAFLNKRAPEFRGR